MTQEQPQVPPVVPPVPSAPPPPPLPGANPDNPFGQPSQNDDFDVNLEGVTSNSFRVPAGAYEAVLSDVIKDISAAGQEMFVWTWRIHSGEQAGKEFKNWTALSPKALWKVAETMEAIGLGSQKRINFKKDQVVGVLAVIHLADDNYEGRLNSKIQRVEAHPNGAGSRPVASGVPA